MTSRTDTNMQDKYIQIDRWSTHYTLKLKKYGQERPIRVYTSKNKSYVDKVIRDLKDRYGYVQVIDKDRRPTPCN
jgi:hypothetical protein